MAFLAPAIPALVGAVASAGAGKLLGGGGASAQSGLGNLSVQAVTPKVMGFTSAGTNATKKGDNFSVRTTNQKALSVKNVVKANLLAANSYRRLAASTKPGFGRLTRSAQEIIGNRRRAAVGDLKETFARRRISGSSFAADAVGRMEAEFAQLERQAVAEAFVQEIDMTTKLVGEEASARTNAYVAQINNMNFDAELGMRLATNGSQVMSQLAQSQAQMYNDMATRGYNASVVNSATNTAYAQPVVSAVRDAVSAGTQTLIDKFISGSSTSGGGFHNPGALGIAPP